MNTLFSKALIITWVIESLIYIILLKRLNINILFRSLIINVITLPMVWFLFPVIIKNNLFCFIVSELSVFLLESLLLYLFFKNVKLAIKLSFLANISSLLLGFTPIWQEVSKV